jgi:superfamily II DNA or RNA helicase
VAASEHDPLRRRFNGQERAALYLASDGRCARCGNELEPGWHADHMKAWSHGGSTDVVNGQALCPTCNLKKGNKDLELREWQKQAKRQYIADSKPDWLLNVTPGGGKTKWALSVASDLLQDGVIDRVVVVVPTDSLREQWAKKQRIVNLCIISNGDGGRENPSFQGCVVTYAQVASQPDLYRMACGRSKTLIIFDEIHHAGDSSSWGQGIETAFTPATRRIAMTGTPWRAPKRGKIPFVRYDIDSKVIADFSFGYSQAVRGGVCRAVQFYPFDGSVTYVNVSTAECCAPQKDIVRLGEVEDDYSTVLRDILRADGKWMSSILQKATQSLDEIRNDVLDAKGLIVVYDRTEARAVARLIKTITHEQPALIISDPEEGEPDPKEELKRFSANQQKWAVAVDMVSEGVDIPPLYVCVYATRKKTPLRFRQIVGRVVRKRPSDDLPAVVFIPAMPKFLEMASEMESELLHVVTEEIKADKKAREERGEEEDDDFPESLVFTTSEAIRTGAIAAGKSYQEHELQLAEKKCIEHGIPTIYAPNIAKILRTQNGVVKPPSPSTPQQETTSLQEEWTLLLSLLNKEIRSLAGILAQRDGIDIGIANRNMNTIILKWFNKPRKQLTIEEIKFALARVRKMRDETIRGND